MARGTLGAIVVIALVVPIVLMLWVRTSFATGQHTRITQPIPFDHRVHAHGLRIDCRYCHSTVETAASAGIPPTIACVGCHNTVWLESKPLAPVTVSLSTNRPIAWQRVNALPDFVFFNHAIHVAKGIGCETCHGRVDQMARVEQEAPLTMGWCLGCHRNPAPYLRPREEITTMGWDAAHRPPALDSLGRRLLHTYTVRSLTSCSTCHR